MFKRIERKRKRREEEEELGLDQDTKETLDLNDTDSDDSDLDSEQELSAQSDDLGSEIGEDREEDAASDDEDVDEDSEPPISVAEALKDSIYLISSDPTVHGCMLCKGKLIKNAEFAAAHKNAKAHTRRFEYFRRLAAEADSSSNAWELVKVIRSAFSTQRAESQELSKRGLKRKVKQAAVREKRKRHKELKAKAIAKKALKELPVADKTTPANTNSQSLPVPQKQPVKARKKQKLEGNTPTSTVTMTRDVTAKSVSRTGASKDGKKISSQVQAQKHGESQQTIIT